MNAPRNAYEERMLAEQTAVLAAVDAIAEALRPLDRELRHQALIAARFSCEVEAPLPKLRPGGLFDGRHCAHRLYRMLDNQRKVVCADCGADLDVFRVLKSYSKESFHVLQLETERRKLQHEISMKHRELDNLKARVRRAADKVIEPPAASAERSKP